MTTKKIFTAFAALTFCFALNAQAQHVRVSAEPSAPAVWSAFIGTQLSSLLESPSEETKTKALVQVIYFASFHGDRLDLTETVPVLLKIYKNDADERCRLAAVAGLRAIGDEAGMQQIRLGIAAQPSKRVQHVALGALMDYYGPGTFERSADMASIAEAVRDHYDTRGRTAPTVIAANN